VAYQKVLSPKYILDCHSILEYLILSENNHPSINHDFLRKIDWDSAVANFGCLPKKRTNPLGTTVYIRKKSNKSPTRKIASASPFTSSSHATNRFSLGKLSAAVGAPKC
jgi:hypothetical protein